MLVAKVKLLVAMEVTIPLGLVSKEDAQKQFDNIGGANALHQQLISHLSESTGDTRSVEVLECSTTLVEI